jgi:hypothetical protein
MPLFITGWIIKMKMKLLPTILAASVFFTAPFAFSATYQSEVSAAYADINDQYGFDDGYAVGLEGKYYFSPVDTTNHPLAEAAFVERSSNIYVKLDNYEFKDSGYRIDFYHRALGVDFYIPNTMFFLGAGIDEYKSKYTAPAEGGVFSESSSSKWDSSWFVKAGIAPVTGLLVWSEFTEDVDVSDVWNINGKYVIPLAGEHALNIEASYEKSKIGYADDTVTAAVDYYFDRNLSVGAGFSHASFDGNEYSDSENDSSYFIRARNHFTDNISVDLSYTDGDYENSLTLGGTIRF